MAFAGTGEEGMFKKPGYIARNLVMMLGSVQWWRDEIRKVELFQIEEGRETLRAPA